MNKQLKDFLAIQKEVKKAAKSGDSSRLKKERNKN